MYNAFLFPRYFMEDQRITLRPPAWLPIVVVLIAGGAYIFGKTIESRHLDRITITVPGEGEVTAVPDIARLTFGVQTGRQPTAKAAMKLLGERMAEAFEAVKAAGVEEQDIASRQLSLSPLYDWQEGERIDRGFEASQTLGVKVRKLVKISDVLDAAVRAGANQAGDVSFTIDDPDALRAEARTEALADAKEKAKTLAAELGVTLGEFRGYWEEGGVPPVMPYAMEAMSLDAEAVGRIAPPLPAGEQEIRVTVNVTYEVY